MYIELLPAYGRDYKSGKDALKDWDELKDFVITTVGHPDCGRYCNLDDVKRYGPDDVYMLRYNQKRDIVQAWPPKKGRKKK